MTQGENVNPYPWKQKRKEGKFLIREKAKKKGKRKEITNQRVGESKKKRNKIPNQRMGESKKKKKKKEEGNVLFKAGKHARASKRYEKVI